MGVAVFCIFFGPVGIVPAAEDESRPVVVFGVAGVDIASVLVLVEGVALDVETCGVTVVDCDCA